MTHLQRTSEPKPPRATRALIHASVALERLQDEAPKGHFTLSWLTTTLRTRSFGMIMLLLALAAIAPGISILAGLLLTVPALQMIVGFPAPTFPSRIAERPLPTRHLATLVRRAVPVLKFLETIIHPRWHMPVDVTKRIVGTIVVLLSISLVFSPIPLSNIVPALLIGLISLAYLEEDGLLLVIALLAAVVVLSLIHI